MINITDKNFERNFMIYFYGRGSTALSLQSHYEERVYFLQTTTVYFLPNTKSLTYPGTHLIDLRRMKGWGRSNEYQDMLGTLQPTSCFEPRTYELGIQCPNHYDIAKGLCQSRGEKNLVILRFRLYYLHVFHFCKLLLLFYRGTNRHYPRMRTPFLSCSCPILHRLMKNYDRLFYNFLSLL